MANNRLFIVDENGDKIQIAKSFSGGWACTIQPDDLTRWFECRDMFASYGGICTPTRLRLCTESESTDTEKREE